MKQSTPVRETRGDGRVWAKLGTGVPKGDQVNDGSGLRWAEYGGESLRWESGTAGG